MDAVPETNAAAKIPQKFQVVDGDTVRFESMPFRLVGFNTPESGTNAQCAAERALSAKATQRLNIAFERRALSATGAVRMRARSEGTDRCNYGRLCGILKLSGKDVAPILIAEGLAEPYICADTRCPPRKIGADRKARRNGLDLPKQTGPRLTAAAVRPQPSSL